MTMSYADQIRNALADPDSPLYMSDLVPLIADYLEETDKRLQWANEAEKRISRASQAIMNIDYPDSCEVESVSVDYARGHRDARHSAAELVLEILAATATGEMK